VSGRVYLVEAGTLNADHIGKLIRFHTWDADREIVTVTTAELRQISHNQAETTLTYGLMAEREVTMRGTQNVLLSPRADYADVEALALANTKAEAE